jgi:hypothetical protein
MQLLFSEDIDRDMRNWQDSFNKESYGIQWKQFLPPSMTVKEVLDDNFLRDYLEKEFYDSGQVSDFKKWLEENIISSQIEEDLSVLMKKPFLSKEITVNITTFRRSPYNVPGNSFFLTRRTYKREISAGMIYHELMHFLFHWHYWDQCKEAGLSEQEIDDFKESLTVLLNSILEKRGLPLDVGYPGHEALRKQWVVLWGRNPDFPVFLEKAIPLYKDSLAKEQKLGA